LVLSLAGVLASLLATGGCVLPIGPEFEEEGNLPPFVVSVLPPEGSQVTASRQPFEVTVEDPNRIDILYAKWLIDYPPEVPELTRIIEVSPQPASSPNTPNVQRLRFLPDCTGEYAISPTISRHRLMLVVSDRKFIDKTVMGTPPEAYTIQLTWSFDKDCLAP
jgi:hypothetical protein